jgi:pimeloyl-ACP methyl ester carboxylesterase
MSLSAVAWGFGEPPGTGANPVSGRFAGLIRIAEGRRVYLECRGRRGPTVVLVSGFPNAADAWSYLAPGVEGPAVLAGVGRSAHVCAYDRSGTVLLSGRLGRSGPSHKLKTIADVVAELHALLRAARIPGPYVLVGHSLGGLVVRLYASTYPAQVAGLVLVDATYEGLRELLPPGEWAMLEKSTIVPSVPGAETVDLNASFDQILRARAKSPLRPTMPLIVLSAGLPSGVFDVRATDAAQNALAHLVPYAQHIIVKNTGHYIQVYKPELVIRATRHVLAEVRPAVVRCRGNANRCRARVSLAGGASDKRITIALPGSGLALVSVRPNRRLSLGAYGLADQQLNANRRQYVFRLYAAQSLPARSRLTFTFSAPS